jgi:hypothetical protein
MVNNMKFTYKNDDYELMLLNEPYENLTFGMIAIFKVHYVIIDKEFNRITVDKNNDYDFEHYEFINYFCTMLEKDDDVEIAKKYIDDYLNKKTL